MQQSAKLKASPLPLPSRVGPQTGVIKPKKIWLQPPQHLTPFQAKAAPSKRKSPVGEFQKFGQPAVGKKPLFQTIERFPHQKLANLSTAKNGSLERPDTNPRSAGKIFKTTAGLRTLPKFEGQRTEEKRSTSHCSNGPDIVRQGSVNRKDPEEFRFKIKNGVKRLQDRSPSALSQCSGQPSRPAAGGKYPSTAQVGKRMKSKIGIPKSPTQHMFYTSPDKVNSSVNLCTDGLSRDSQPLQVFVSPTSKLVNAGSKQIDNIISFSQRLQAQAKENQAVTDSINKSLASQSRISSSSKKYEGVKSPLPRYPDPNFSLRVNPVKKPGFDEPLRLKPQGLTAEPPRRKQQEFKISKARKSTNSRRGSVENQQSSPMPTTSYLTQGVRPLNFHQNSLLQESTQSGEKLLIQENLSSPSPGGRGRPVQPPQIIGTSKNAPIAQVLTTATEKKDRLLKQYLSGRNAGTLKSRNSKQSDLFCQAYLNKLYSHTENFDEVKRQAEKVTLSYMALSMDNLKKKKHEKKPQKTLFELKAVYAGVQQKVEPVTKFSLKPKIKTLRKKQEASLPDIHNTKRQSTDPGERHSTGGGGSVVRDPSFERDSGYDLEQLRQMSKIIKKQASAVKLGNSSTFLPSEASVREEEPKKRTVRLKVPPPSQKKPGAGDEGPGQIRKSFYSFLQNGSIPSGQSLKSSVNDFVVEKFNYSQRSSAQSQVRDSSSNKDLIQVFKEPEITGSVTLRQSQLIQESLPHMIVENEEGIPETPKNPASAKKEEGREGTKEGWPARTEAAVRASAIRNKKFLQSVVHNQKFETEKRIEFLRKKETEDDRQVGRLCLTLADRNQLRRPCPTDEDCLSEIRTKEDDGFIQTLDSENSEHSPDRESSVMPRASLKSAADCELYKLVKIGKQLGEGAYGQVFKGFNTSTHTFMVVKRIPIPEHIAEQKSERSKQILNEIHILSSLEHPNIVRYYDSCLLEKERCECGFVGQAASGSKAVSSTNGHITKRSDCPQVHCEILIYMEQMPQGSIRQLIDRFGPFKNEKVLQSYTKQILAGLNYLHSRNVIHGDIKAANLLSDLNANLKLSDFGASKIIEGIPADLEASMSGRLYEHCRGSLYWMAPEILFGEPYGRRSDIWALGCTLIEIATGKHPWYNRRVQTLEELRNLILHSEAPHIPEDLPANCKDFIRQCLELNKSSRPLSKELLEHPFVVDS